jgi:hypothetical protein
MISFGKRFAMGREKKIALPGWIGVYGHEVASPLIQVPAF